MISYAALAAAIVCEVIGTSALTKTEQFTRVGPTVVTITAYVLSFYLLSISLRVLPVGVVYATWSGLGIVLISGVGWAVLGQRLDGAALLGMALILIGVVTIFAFSNSAGH